MKTNNQMIPIRKSLCLFLISLSLFFHPPESKAQGDENALLWKISGNGLSATSYLLGTIHLIPRADFFWPQHTLKSLMSTQQLILETDINMGFQEQLKWAKKTLLPDHKQIADYLTTKEYRVYKDFCKNKLNLSRRQIKNIRNLQPIFAYSVILSNQTRPSKSYESELNSLAKKADLPVLGLETVEFQFDLVTNIPVKEQLKMFMEEGAEAQYRQLVSHYKAQNLKKLEELMLVVDNMPPGLPDDLLMNRNEKWLPLLEKHIRQKSSFVAVGAGHLPGKTGLISLLRQAGYSVVPVK